MSRWRIAAGGALVVTAVLFPVPIPPAGATAGPPPTFDIDVSAAPVHSISSFTAAVPLDVPSGAAFSRVQLNSQPNAIGTAGPGYLPLVESAPVLFGLPAPPASTACYSYFPGQPSEASCGGPAQGTGGFNTAAASGHTASSGDARDPAQLRSEASVRASHLGAAPEIPIPVAIGQAASAATAGADGDRMAAGASTEVSDIAVAGVLTIDSVTSSVAGAVGGTPGSASHETTLTVTGAAVAGMPVTIDNNGVTANDQSAPNPLGTTAQEQVNAALAAAGLQVRTTPPAEPVAEPDGTRVQAASGGLVVTFSDPQGAVAFTLTIGQSALRMQGFRNLPAARPAEPAPPADLVIVGHTNAPSITPPSAAPSPPPPPRPGATSPAPSTRPFVQAAALPGWRIPYPPFALLALALPVLARSRRLTFTWR